MPIDKPILSIQAAQKAAADANALAQAAQEAAGVVNSIPGATPTKTWVLRILGAVGVVGVDCRNGFHGRKRCRRSLPGPPASRLTLPACASRRPPVVDKFGQGVAKQRAALLFSATLLTAKAGPRYVCA